MSTRKSSDALGLILDVTDISGRTPDNDRLWHGLLSCDSLAFDTVEGCLPMNYGSSRTR